MAEAAAIDLQESCARDSNHCGGRQRCRGELALRQNAGMRQLVDQEEVAPPTSAGIMPELAR